MRLGSQVKYRLQVAQSALRDPFRKSGVVAPGWEGIRPVFIISTGRTGTHFLMHFFNNNLRDVFAVHEPDIDIYDVNQHFVRGKLSEHRAQMMLRDFRTGMLHKLKSTNTPVYVESNNNLSFLIPLVRKEFPDHKIIYIQRDGRDFVRSAYSKSTSGKWVGEVRFMSDNDPRIRLNARFFSDDPYYSKWDSMSRFERICWLWAKKDGHIFHELKNDPNTIALRFEKLFKEQDLAEWHRMLDFVDLRNQLVEDDILAYIRNNKSNEIKNFSMPKWPDWTDEQKATFRTIAGPHMAELGYTLD